MGTAIQLDDDACYRALCSRDGRFDGVFFVAVKTTGIYCRPICPVRAPGQDRCVFYTRAAEAERAGFRACFRCRPELAPGNAVVDSVPRLVRAAVARIEAGFLNEASIDDLAAELGVSARHLRRAMEQKLGVSPVELAQTRRLALAKQLLGDTSLRLTDVAFASGFSSLRRFNASFRERFGCSPSSLKRNRTAANDAIELRLDYRRPLDFTAMLEFLRARSIPGVERVDDGLYRRTVSIGTNAGEISVGLDQSAAHLRARISLSLAPKLMAIVTRLRALFDLDAQPTIIADHLRADPFLKPAVARSPGLRVPGAFDPFETSVRTILGQQVSVRAATTLSGRLARAFGRPTPSPTEGLERLFPSAAEIASASEGAIASLGMPGARAQTILALARGVVEKRIDLSGGSGPEEVVEQLVELPGIGEWTANYIAMRALRWSNAFPAGDLGVRRALGTKTASEAKARAHAWEPWRAYAVMHLWTGSSQGG
jgi:AraC family transcriptional regulator of adaptative response / DNA-3-methyladenine glycosylase II